MLRFWMMMGDFMRGIGGLVQGWFLFYILLLMVNSKMSYI
jgi:hypothetical protein